MQTQRDIYLHPIYAVRRQREPLAILDGSIWAREKKDELGQRGGPKASLCWIEGDERIVERAPCRALTRALPRMRETFPDVTRPVVRRAMQDHPYYCQTAFDFLVKATTRFPRACPGSSINRYPSTERARVNRTHVTGKRPGYTRALARSMANGWRR